MNTALVRCYRSEPALGQSTAQASGQLSWYAQDPRLAVMPQTLAPDELDRRWPELTAQAMGQGQRAVLWLRDDAEVHDHFLADRVLELAPGRWQIHDAAGQTMAQVEVGPDTKGQTEPTRPWPLSIAMAHASMAHIDPSVQDAPELWVVSASRASAQDFYTQTALGQSIQRLRQRGARIRLMAVCNNQQALAHAYNRVLTQAHAEHLVAFIHDDVTLHDWHLNVHLNAALEHYDLVGLAGSKTIRPRQPSWAFPERIGQWAPPGELLGSVGHDTRLNPASKTPFHGLTRYGAPKGAAALLDGVFLACKVKTLTAHGVRFDPDLPFHFYDLDLCRQAARASLRLGVWPLAITHHSGGQFQTPEWQKCHQHYLNKWGDTF